MAKAKFTKYGDDEYVLRLDRKNALRLLSAIGKYAAKDHLLKDDETDNVHHEMFDTLKGLLSDADFNKERCDTSTSQDVMVKPPTLYIVPWNT